MSTAIVWFRQDLRLKDNPALYHAAKKYDAIIPLYILDEQQDWSLGGAQKWWLHHSLTHLQNNLEKLGLQLILRKGASRKILQELTDKNIAAVYWNRCYEPSIIQRDTEIKSTLKKNNIDVETFNSHLIHEPWEVSTLKGDFYKVFTPFWRAWCKTSKDFKVLPTPSGHMQTKKISSDHLNHWKLLPEKPNWANGFTESWTPGEKAAHQQLKKFLSKKIMHYSKGRDFPADQSTSYLSPYLHFGEISPRQIFTAVKEIEVIQSQLFSVSEHFLKELVWREFAYHLLYYFPDLPEENFKKEFNEMKWVTDKKLLHAWQKGQTGFPLIDAGMRELWHTGYMHNRVRMIVASFLTKHLLIDWREGEKWFWDTLVDADLANNAMNWQWVAGCGVDAAPFFRIFNPILQSRKFDPAGDYIRRWVPELAHLSKKEIHVPVIRKHYPEPIVDLNVGRKRALNYYKKLKKL
jgi:deoxyribodipyrimidine photo-lyase